MAFFQEIIGIHVHKKCRVCYCNCSFELLFFKKKLFLDLSLEDSDGAVCIFCIFALKSNHEKRFICFVLELIKFPLNKNAFIYYQPLYYIGFCGPLSSTQRPFTFFIIVCEMS